MGNIKCEDILGVSQCDEESSGKESRYCFEIITAGRAFLFAAETENDMEDWISTIKQVSFEIALVMFDYNSLDYSQRCC